MKSDEMIKLCANGNHEAAVFMVAFHRFCHLVDDIVDDPASVGVEHMVGTLMAFIVNVSSNSFYQAHRGRFEGLFDAAAGAWLDSDRLRVSERADERTTNVLRGTLKGWYHEVFFQCARLTGGWQKMREATALCREYDIEPRETRINGVPPANATREGNGVL